MKLNLSCKAILSAVLFLLFLMAAAGQDTAPREPSSAESAFPDDLIFGIWESGSRFIEISPEGRMRIVLKPYYAFVYESEGWIPCQVLKESAFDGGGVYTLSVTYPAVKVPQAIPVAIIEGESLYTAFYAREEGAMGQESLPEALSGFWGSRGGTDAIRLYGESPADEFFCLYFDGGRYYRIRYWRSDARPAPLQAVFQGSRDGEPLSVPKFLYRDGFLYTCVTGTGTALRNYEQGSWELSEGEISFFADKIAFAGRQASETALARFSGDGEVMLLGEPQFTRSAVTDMEAAIAERNVQARPQRKPPVELMDLDFHWDEVERLRKR